MIFSPPLWGGRRAAARRGGAPFLCRPGQALPRAAGRAPPPFSAPGRRRKPGLAAARDQPKENHGRAPDRGPPPPRRPGDGGAPPGGGRIRRRRGTGAGQAANPTPRRPQPAAGPPPPRQSAPGGGCRPPVFGRPATRPDAGRPRAGGPAASHQPTPTAARAHGPGPDKAGLVAIGAGAAGPGQYRPGLHPTGRIHLLAQPATFGGGRATATGAAPAAGRSSARDSGRAEGPRGGRIRSRGHPSRSWGGVAAKKNAGRLAPPRLDTTGRKKNAGRTLCPPRLPL